MSTYKFSILTFIFGENYECLREINDVRDDIEYICVTDNKALTSSAWHIIYDEINPEYAPFRKCLEVRYNPFKYVHSDVCMIIDGSLQLNRIPDNLLEKIRDDEYDLATFVHPNRSKLLDELDVWIRLRSFPAADKAVFEEFMRAYEYDPNLDGLYQINMLVFRNTARCKEFRECVLSCNNSLADENSTFRVDQVVFSMLLQSQFADLKFLPITADEQNANYLIQYAHNSQSRCHPFFNPNTSTHHEGYVHGMKQELANFSNVMCTKNNVTFVTCNFNTTELTNACIKSAIKNSGVDSPKFIVLDNSDRGKFDLDNSLTHHDIQVLDNTQGQLINFAQAIRMLSDKPAFNHHANLKHTLSIEFLLNACTTDIAVILDSDIILRRKLDFLDAFGGKIAAFQTEPGYTNPKIGSFIRQRALPFLCAINISMMRELGMSYFDSHRIAFGLGNSSNQYDTGGSFLEDVITRNLSVKHIRCSDYIDHLAGASEYSRDPTQFLKRNFAYYN